MEDLCEICGERHHPRQAHRFPAVANMVIPAVANKGGHPDTMRVQLWREANRERYNQRQRELMRRRRHVS